MSTSAVLLCFHETTFEAAVQESAHLFRFFQRVNANTGQHYSARFTTKQHECFIFASDIHKKHMDINGKIRQKMLSEGRETEKKRKKCMYATDIYKGHGSFQDLGIKRPKVLTFQIGLLMSGIYAREEKKKNPLKKKEPCLIRLYSTDIYSRASLFQRPSAWPKLSSCSQAGTRAPLSVCSSELGSKSANKTFSWWQTGSLIPK